VRTSEYASGDEGLLAAAGDSIHTEEQADACAIPIRRRVARFPFTPHST